MKKFNLFAIGVVAMLMAAVNVSAEDFDKTSNCTEQTGSTCTLKNPVALSSATEISEDLTIVTTETNTLTVNASQTLTIAAGKKLTVDGGYVDVKGTIVVGNGAKLIVKNAKKTGLQLQENGTLPAGGYAIRMAASSKIEVKDEGLVELFSNDRGLVALDASATVDLSHATLKIHDNSQNAMNGGIVTAEYSVIEVNNNEMGGFNAALTAKYNTTLTATGNGYSGVTLQEGSSIDSTSSIVSTGNLVGNKVETAKRETLKADLSLNGAVTINGTLKATSVGPEKKTYGDGKVNAGAKITLSKTANVSVSETKSFCDDDKYNQATGCSALTSMSFEGNGVATVDKTAYVYGDAGDVKTDSSVDEVVVTKDATVSKITVAAGTKVSNLTGASVYAQIEGETSLVEIPKATTVDGEDVAGTAVVGTKPAEQTPTPGEEQGGNQGSGNEGNNDETTTKPGANNPDTLDNVTSVAAMGGISLAIAAAGIATLKKREN